MPDTFVWTCQATLRFFRWTSSIFLLTAVCLWYLLCFERCLSYPCYLKPVDIHVIWSQSISMLSEANRYPSYLKPIDIHVIWSQSISMLSEANRYPCYLKPIDPTHSLTVHPPTLRQFYWPKFPCSLTFLTESIFLSVIVPLICYNLLFRISPLQLYISEVFKNIRDLLSSNAHMKAVTYWPSIKYIFIIYLIKTVPTCERASSIYRHHFENSTKLLIRSHDADNFK